MLYMWSFGPGSCDGLAPGTWRACVGRSRASNAGPSAIRMQQKKRCEYVGETKGIRALQELWLLTG